MKKVLATVFVSLFALAGCDLQSLNQEKVETRKPEPGVDQSPVHKLKIDFEVGEIKDLGERARSLLTRYGTLNCENRRKVLHHVKLAVVRHELALKFHEKFGPQAKDEEALSSHFESLKSRRQEVEGELGSSGYWLRSCRKAEPKPVSPRRKRRR